MSVVLIYAALPLILATVWWLGELGAELWTLASVVLAVVHLF